MATLFQNILKNAADKGIIDKHSKQSMDWFRTTIRKTSVDPSRLMREEQANYISSWSSVGIGKLYFAWYDPKHKKTLPYYDMFPLIIPIERYSDGILGLNLHYLPPTLRAKLFDSLYSTVNNAKLDENKKMLLSYQLLSGIAKHNLFKPCVKRYLGNHFRSRFVRIPHDNWVPAIFLPVEQFEKASRNVVWNNSKNIAKGK